jgi:hypothetical protein
VQHAAALRERTARMRERVIGGEDRLCHHGARRLPGRAVTYEIVCAKDNRAAALPLLKGFLDYACSAAGEAAVTRFGSAPLTGPVRTKVVDEVTNLS